MSEVSGGGTEAAPTFASVFAADASPASDPQSTPEHDATAAAQPEGAEAETRQTARETGEDDRSPFIPRQRFDEVNSRVKELKAWREQYAWAEHVDQGALRTMQDWFGRAAHDPRAFALDLLDELSQHPDHSAHVRSELARRLGTRAGAAPQSEAAMPPPDMDVTDAQGNVIGKAYSDKALVKLLEQTRQQTIEAVKSELAPKFTTLDKIEQQARAQDAQAAADQMVTAFVTELSSLPGFSEHKRAIGEYLRAHPAKTDHPADVQAATYRAYHAVVTPKLSNPSPQAVLADLQRKASAATSVNPRAAAGGAAPITSFEDARLKW